VHRRSHARATAISAVDSPSDRRPLRYLVAVLAIALGVAGIVYGEADDSPGLQLIGVALVVGAVAMGIRTAQRSR
jgi:drug/metabolite transporter (DMT)-like permease